MRGYGFGCFSWLTLLSDGTIYARAGTKTTCGGIAGIHVRITPSESGITEFTATEGEGWEGDEYGSEVPGSVVPEPYREAVYAGARQALEDLRPGLAVRFELIDALVHLVDARTSRFRTAGCTAMTGWLELYESEPSGLTSAASDPPQAGE